MQDIHTDQCDIKLLFMHRPTHEPQREKSGQYPFSWHLGKRRRLWEIRMQLRFKVIPKGPLYFGVELENFVPVPLPLRQAQKALVTSCRKIVGDCYHSAGDDPASTEGEPEPPVFVMPLWAVDQFLVSESGAEPDLTGDLEGMGMRRVEGVDAYIRAMKAVARSFSTTSVYTFCFWGVSQFLDCMKWEISGGLPGVRFDLNRLCGPPPIFLTMYDLPAGQKTEQRHLQSLKRHFCRVAVWSALHSPDVADVSQPLQPAPKRDVSEAAVALASALEPEVLKAPEVETCDLLGFTADAAPAKQAGQSATPQHLQDVASAPATATASQAETCDLLGLDFS